MNTVLKVAGMMKNTLAILFTISIICTSVFALTKENEKSRIIGGAFAKPGQFPYIVSLRDWYGNHHCGGVIVHEFWVLTTALCVYGSTKDYFIIVAGSNILESGGTPYRISAIRIHPEYDIHKIKNNIAMLMVTAPIKFNKFVKDISLESSHIGSNITAVIAAWGSTLYPGLTSSNELKYLKVQTVKITTCQKQHSPSPVYNDSELCTLSKDKNGACLGDAGGPLMYDDKLIGLISWGEPCAMGYPDVHTRISKFIHWITQLTL